MTGTQSRKAALGALVAAGALWTASVAAAPGSSAEPVGAAGPSGADRNLWLIVLDDATVADVEAMPAVGSLLADQGVSFTNAYVPFPECCPSRATLLTGRYPHNHGVLDSQPPFGGWTFFDDGATLATWLDPAYETGLVGKYLNGYGLRGTETYVPPGWDHWAAPPGAANVYDYMDRTLNVNGTLTGYRGVYSTSQYGTLSRQFIADASEGPEPFALVTSFVANHAGTPADPGDPGLPSPYVSEPFRDTVRPSVPRSPSTNEADVSDKPAYVRRQALLTSAQLAEIAEVHAQRQEALAAADEEIRLTVQQLQARGELDSTTIVLLSDNGYLEGQHRLTHGKNVPYEPAVRMPLVIRGPGIPAGRQVEALVGEADLAPTILSRLGQEQAHFGPAMDGQDLSPLIAGTGGLGERPILLEIGDLRDDSPRTLRGVVTPDRWKYVDYTNSAADEMYDLRGDPDELDNLFGIPRYSAVQKRLERVLSDYRDCAGRTCRARTEKRG